MDGTSSHHKGRVVDYYIATKRDYYWLWRSNRSLGIHFGYYDAENTTHDAAVLNLNRQLAQRAGITEHDHVLDAGCGIGGSSLWLAANRGCQVLGINIVPWQIARAKKLARARHLESLVQFRLSDYASTGLKAGSFSVVWGLESIVHAEDKQAVLQEFFRLLRPGGRLIICEYLLTSRKLSAANQMLIDQWLGGWAMPSLLTTAEYKAYLETAGFKHVTVHDWTRHVQPSFRRLERLVAIFKPLAPIARYLHLVNAGQLRNLEASDAQMQSLQRGVWRYNVIVAQKP